MQWDMRRRQPPRLQSARVSSTAQAPRRDGGDCVEPFRQLCGPADPEVAAALRPHSLRARFGVDKNRNAVHCTDLPEDAPLEVNYFFRILPQCGG